jgi:hypothetical protein
LTVLDGSGVARGARTNDAVQTRGDADRATSEPSISGGGKEEVTAKGRVSIPEGGPAGKGIFPAGFLGC